MKKTKEEKLWNWLNRQILARELDSPTARKVFDYITKHYK